MGGAPSVQAPKPPDAGVEFGQALQAYTSGAPALYQEESQYQPLYNQMQRGMEQENINAYAQQYFGLMPEAQAAATASQQQASLGQLQNMQALAPQVSQTLMSSMPQYGQMSDLAKQQMSAGMDPRLTSLYQNVMGAIPGQQQAFQNLATQAGQQLTPINQQLQTLATQSQAGTDQTVAQLGKLPPKRT